MERIKNTRGEKKKFPYGCCFILLPQLKNKRVNIFQSLFFLYGIQ